MDKIIAKILIDKIGRETVDKFIEDDKGDLARVETISLEALAEEIADTLKKQGYGDTKQAVREFAERLEEIKHCVRDLNVCFDAEWRYLLEDTLDKIDELLAEVTGE